MDTKIAITRYEMMIAKYSPKSSKNGVKSHNTSNTCTPLIHIIYNIYTYILININLLRERMREEKEEREKNERERYWKERGERDL